MVKTVKPTNTQILSILIGCPEPTALKTSFTPRKPDEKAAGIVKKKQHSYNDLDYITEQSFLLFFIIVSPPYSVRCLLLPTDLLN